MIPWDWQTGEFGGYRAGCTTFFIKMWYELGLVNHLLMADTEDVRNMLHGLNDKKAQLSDSLEKLKEKSVYNARRNKFISELKTQGC